MGRKKKRKEKITFLFHGYLANKSPSWLEGGGKSSAIAWNDACCWITIISEDYSFGRLSNTDWNNCSKYNTNAKK